MSCHVRLPSRFPVPPGLAGRPGYVAFSNRLFEESLVVSPSANRVDAGIEGCRGRKLLMSKQMLDDDMSAGIVVE